MPDPIEREVYSIRSRNLVLAVYNGQGGFIGIREKRGSRYLDTEFLNHTVRWDSEAIAIDTVPEPIRLVERVGATHCQYCGALAVWTPDEPGARRGTWSCESLCIRVRPSTLSNRPLFEFLDDIEERLGLL